MEEPTNSIGAEEIDGAMRLIIEVCEMNSVCDVALLAASFNIVCDIMQRKRIRHDTILEFASHFEYCLEEISATVLSKKISEESK